jgi:hypothetical protein
LVGQLEFRWPKSLQIDSKVDPKFQPLNYSFSFCAVPIWEMLNNEWKLFGNNPDENYIEISGEEWTELMEEAMKRVAPKCGEIQPKMRQAYRQENRLDEFH